MVRGADGGYRLIFGEKDVHQLKSAGKTPEEAEGDMAAYEAGVPPIRLQRPCRLNDGIIAHSVEQQLQMAKRYQTAMASGRAMKFVAASGAASRMFAAALACLEKGWVTQQCLVAQAIRGDPNAQGCLNLLRNLPKLAFWSEISTLIQSKGLRLEELIEGGDYEAVLENILQPDGLGYSDFPKGLIPFHSYPNGTRTAFEEHLAESPAFLKDSWGIVRIHFTVSPKHADRVEEHLRQAKSRLNPHDTRYEITLSVQKQSTDSIVVDENNRLLRDKNGELVLRPSGHGALLGNLNSCKGDIVFIRTIDNVLPDHLKETVQCHKRILGGYLIELQEELFRCIRFLVSGNSGELSLEHIHRFAEARLNLILPKELSRMSIPLRSQALFRILNAPLRVCGIVRNSDYPGGRPFWVRGADGIVRPQIVEPAQVNMEDSEQNAVWRSCEFFNPADLVCGVRDYLGRPFDLERFSNPGEGFIARKIHESRRCKVLERPGLWNGAMAHWNTVFVEVPAITLRPIKSILDLLD